MKPAILPIVDSANDDVRYDERLNGRPVLATWRVVHPVPVLDPDVGSDYAWRRLRLHVVR